MPLESVTRREIEAKLANVGDYVKMDYLQACLKKNMDFDTKKFVLLTLAQVYEGRRMFLEAGKLIRNAADINTTFDGKIRDFVKSGELFVRAARYDEADVSFAKALAMATEKQKQDIKASKKNFIKAQAQDLLKRDKRKLALDAYEKLLTTDLSATEKADTQRVLLDLYQKLGKVREYGLLRDAIKNPASRVQPLPSKQKQESKPFRIVRDDDLDSLFS